MENSTIARSRRFGGRSVAIGPGFWDIKRERRASRSSRCWSLGIVPGNGFARSQLIEAIGRYPLKERDLQPGFGSGALYPVNIPPVRTLERFRKIYATVMATRMIATCQTTFGPRAALPPRRRAGQYLSAHCQRASAVSVHPELTPRRLCFTMQSPTGEAGLQQGKVLGGGACGKVVSRGVFHGTS